MSSPRPHLLFVAWGFPPCRAGGVYRALATANAFARHGWDVTVLTVERDVFVEYTGADLGLEQSIDPSIEVVRTRFSWPALETDIRRFSWLRVRFPRIWSKLRVSADRRPFPETGYGPWRRELERSALALHERRPVDLVVATANPHVAFMAARILHERHKVPYVMDYRDAWCLDVFSGDRLHDEHSRTARIERDLIDKAAEVWFVNEPIRAWHQHEHPRAAARMQVVSNGWDFDVAAQRDGSKTAGRALTFGYLGTVSVKVPLAEFIAGWRQAHESHGIPAGSRAVIRGYLGFYGLPRPDLMALVDGAASDGVEYAGPASKSEVVEVYSGFDVLLLILGSGKYVTSGKVFEYLATGLPIVSVHDLGNAASDVLRDYPLWFPSKSLAPQDICEALGLAAEAATNASEAARTAARAYAEQYRRDRQLAPRLKALRELVDTARNAADDSADVR